MVMAIFRQVYTNLIKKRALFKDIVKSLHFLKSKILYSILYGLRNRMNILKLVQSNILTIQSL